MNEHAPIKALSAIRVGTPLQAIMPQTLDDVARLAKLAVLAGLVVVPKKRRRNDDEEDAADALDEEGKLTAVATMVILQGLEVNLAPMQSLQTIALINGRPLIWGDAVPALLWRAGFKIDEWFVGDETKPDDGFVAHCRVTRPDGSIIERLFSVADAKRAKLWDAREKVTRYKKGGRETYTIDNDAPWFRFWKRMLQMRARGFACKDGASDVLRGLYIREEYEDNEIVDVTPVSALSAAPTAAASTDVPDIPPDDPEPDRADDASGITDPIETLSPEQEEFFLEKLQDDLACCGSSEEREEVASSNIEMFERLSDVGRRKAEGLVQGRKK